jgi:hypothetical protein
MLDPSCLMYEAAQHAVVPLTVVCRQCERLLLHELHSLHMHAASTTVAVHCNKH